VFAQEGAGIVRCRHSGGIGSYREQSGGVQSVDAGEDPISRVSRSGRLGVFLLGKEYRLVTDLKAADFVVREDGNPQDAASVTRKQGICKRVRRCSLRRAGNCRSRHVRDESKSGRALDFRLGGWRPALPGHL
jgi:hypothetical protein